MYLFTVCNAVAKYIRLFVRDRNRQIIICLIVVTNTENHTNHTVWPVIQICNIYTTPKHISINILIFIVTTCIDWHVHK